GGGGGTSHGIERAFPTAIGGGTAEGATLAVQSDETFVVASPSAGHDTAPITGSPGFLPSAIAVVFLHDDCPVITPKGGAASCATISPGSSAAASAGAAVPLSVARI
ncbi:unnamed protein product, partial [Musa banksii]